MDPLPPTKPPIDAEYFIGAKVLPRLAAAIITLGLVYLVSLGVQSGFITPAMLFGAVCTGCAGFIGVGLLKRDEREEFGQILTGIGSCGLYLNFAAGHIFQNLYGGETLVALFVLLSLANLGFSLWRASKVFLSIGLSGGLLAAVMPLQEGNVALNVGLHFLIVVPAALIAARNRWAEALVAIYVVATLAILPATFGYGHWPLTVAALYGTALVCGAALAYRDLPLKWDPQGLTVPAGLFASALIAFGRQYSLDGTGHVLGFALAAGILGTALRKTQAGRNMLFGAVAVALTIAPFGLPAHQVPSVLAILGLGCVLVSQWRYGKPASALAAIETGLATLAYLGVVATGLEWQAEASLLLLIGASLVGSTYALARSWGNVEPFVLGTSMLLVPVFVRLVQVVLGSPIFGTDVVLGVTIGSVVYALALVGLTAVSRWQSAAVLLWVVLLSGLLLLSGLVFGAPSLPTLLEGLILSTFVVTTVGAALVSGWRADWGSREALLGVAGLVVGTLWVRLGFLLLTLPVVRLNGDLAVSLACSGFAMSAAWLGSRRQSPALSGVAAVFAFPAVVMTLGLYSRSPLAVAVVVTVAALAGVVAATQAVLRTVRQPEFAYYLGVTGGWALLTRLGTLMLAGQGLGLAPNAAVTASWIVAAAAALVLGFIKDVIHMRIAGLGILAVTVGKVMMVDLADTSQAVKVAVLMGLGLTMLAGGYLYIRRREPAT
jgi:hypothetical protein